jgi:hypothetical protein
MFMVGKAQRVVLIASMCAALGVEAFAQQSSPLGGNSTGEDRAMAGERVEPKTALQLFAEKLKLDAKTQVPAVEEILSGAAKEAGPVGQQMLQLRQQLVNLDLAKKADEEKKPVVAAYADAAAKMAGIEARAFARVYAMLKPNQQSGAAQAFAIMAGIFQPAAPRPGAARGQRGGGRP